MSDLLTRQLAQKLLLPPRERLQLQQCVVTAVAAGPPKTLTVTIGGSAVTVPGVSFLSSYTAPTVNDVVWAIGVPGDLLVLGTVANLGGLKVVGGLGLWGKAAAAQGGAIASPTNSGVGTAATAATNVSPWGYSQAQADAIRVLVNILLTDMGNMKTAVDAIRADLSAVGIIP